MGCRPLWDHASGRVTGVEVLPTAAMGRARVDVTWRISGLFRDLFPAQIALHRCRRAGRRRARRRRRRKSARRRRGAPSGARQPRSHLRHRAGRLRRRRRGSARPRCRCAQRSARPISRPTSHAYGGADGEGGAAPGAFAQRVAAADLLVHPSDDPGRDLLEGAEDAAFVGGFAAAAQTARPRRRSRHARHDRSAAAARAIAVGGAGAHRARARDQSALHRRADAARPARRRRACRDRRPAGRFRAKPPARSPSELFDLAARRLCRRPARCATFCCAKIRRPPRRSPSGSTPRGGAASGIRAATTSTPASRHCAARAAGKRHEGRDDRANLATPVAGASAPKREGTCAPRRLSRLSTPMPTGDGLLVRLLPIGTIALDAFAALCAAARAHGNGIIESHRARQHPGARTYARFGAALRRGDRRARASRRRTAFPLSAIRSPDSIRKRCSMRARSPRDLRARAGARIARRIGSPKVSVAIDGGGRAQPRRHRRRRAASRAN